MTKDWTVVILNISFSCVPPAGDTSNCANNDPRCPGCCGGAGGSGKGKGGPGGGVGGIGGVGGGGGDQGGKGRLGPHPQPNPGDAVGTEVPGAKNSSGMNDLMVTSMPVGVQDGSDYCIYPTKFLMSFQLSFFNMSSNGKFKLSPTIMYSSLIQYYSANINGNTSFGPGWIFDFDSHLEYDYNTGNFIFREPTGLPSFLIKQEGQNVWYSAAFSGITAKLTTEYHPVYSTLHRLLFDDVKTEYGFKNDGKLVYIKDNNGNKLIFSYNGSNKLVRVDAESILNSVDIDDRYITFEYNDDWTRITKVTASDGREIQLTYETEYPKRLKEIYFKKNAQASLYKLYQFYYEYSITGYQITEIHTNRGDGTFGKLYSFEYENQNGFRYIKKQKDTNGQTIIEVYYPSWAPEYVKAIKDNLEIKYYINWMRIPYKTEYIINSQIVNKTEQTTYSWQYGDSVYTKGHKDDAGNQTNFTYEIENDDYTDPRNMRIARVDYPDETYRLYNYNSSGNITSERDKRGYYTYYSYNANGNLTSVTNALNQTTTYSYDALGRMTSVTDAMNKTTSYTYNNYGQILTITNPEDKTTSYTYNSWGLITAITDQNNRTTNYTYNNIGFLEKVKDNQNNETINTYNSSYFRTGVTDPKGNTTQYTYNIMGDLIKVKDARNNETELFYNKYGLLTKVKDARLKETNYTYDDFGKLICETDPLNKSINYEYYNSGGSGCCGAGGEGQIKKKTDAKNQVIEYEYDIMNRFKKILYPNSQYVEFTYDNNGNRLTMFDTRLSDYFTTPTFSYQYDALNRETRETYPNGDYIEYAYNEIGQRTSMRYPNGDTQTYSYDSTSRRLTELYHPKSGTTSYSYDSQGLLYYFVYPNNLFSLFDYDTLYRISTISLENLDLYGYIYRISYNYDNNGNRTIAGWTSDVNEDFNFNKTYTYDVINQMLSETKQNNQTLYSYAYTFDAVGNRTQMIYNEIGESAITTTYTCNNGNQLTQRTVSPGNNVWSYSYDNNGNLSEESKSGPRRDFFWNEEDKLIGVENFSQGAVVINYVYDAMGRRLIRKNQSTGEWRIYYYDGLSIIAEKKKPSIGSWSWDKIYTISGGEISYIIAESDWNESYWENKFYHYDAIGNVACLTDSNGEPLDFFDQDAYGNIKSGTQSGYHLHTKEYDNESNLYYSNARWYDPQLGRFISKDPIVHLIPWIINKVDANTLIDYGANPLDLNPYIFASNNPLKYIDESGGCVKKPGKKGRGGTPSPTPPGSGEDGNNGKGGVPTTGDNIGDRGESIAERAVGLPPVGTIMKGGQALGKALVITKEVQQQYKDFNEAFPEMPPIVPLGRTCPDKK